MNLGNLGESALERFVRESNLIEGIDRAPTDYELEAHRRLLARDFLALKTIEDFVFDICGKQLRREAGMDVRVGPHFPPKGCPAIESALEMLIGAINAREESPYSAHCRYEKLHPFMDGNGRSGRAIWAWQMQRDGHNPFSLPFLHYWYYHSLDASRVPVEASS